MLNFLKIISTKRTTSPEKPAVRERPPALPRLTWRTSSALANRPRGPACSRYSGAAIGTE